MFIATLCLSRRLSMALAAAALAGAFPSLASAQSYPVKPVKVVVGYSAGGAVDAVARTVGQAMSASMGQTFVVENKPGAGTNIAVKSVIAAEPDGYTLMMAANALAANMALYQPAPFDAERDLVPVSLIGRVPVVIAANASAPYANIQQLIAAARAKPGSISFASPGNGSTPHMAVEFFKRAAGVSLLHIPYRGGSQALTDVIGGQLPLVAVNALEVQPHVKSGKLKVLAVLSTNRSTIFPDVPTIAESGFPGFEASVWYGLVAPAATPKAIVSRLHAEVQKALQTKEVHERMTQVGGEVLPGSAEMFAALIRSERQRYEKLVREANIKTD
ncbi:MAG: tripartite tricarboxylate transporter substrate binding protein [Polaromonas sp.]|uniref:tripartite tricarboxylate transporter substrate binding protein n=1 Tax=Polaromonas sp. TaxID=1869339 RepID=UPI00273164AA|nr:tripartite tricarboxylate transporter substrate binding protein [Polaromonas sp.]MDP2450670.1 tripartite tricarboxylate transporter substrate binding protein [Polaromonas sp.]MDP3249363.1 tripartite tricarboxylate transporter substrate binding protein [Polaromonas sp.]MDP3754961.1 tripartite tricarboxylate transporter substrate binding protein [Polaromonas sp.]MDP3828312.1 tripartite tricarboxylate transporter substrate binding protein [Polaromonas sp.]